MGLGFFIFKSFFFFQMYIHHDRYQPVSIKLLDMTSTFSFGNKVQSSNDSTIDSPVTGQSCPFLSLRFLKRIQKRIDDSPRLDTRVINESFT